MNAKLTHTELKHWEQTLHTTLSREETLEMIVPDACPDILEIVQTRAAAELRCRECAAGSVTLGGRVRCGILYRPEGAEGLERLRTELPVQVTAELEAAAEQSQCLLTSRVTLAETRAINPRKVLIRVVLSLELSLFTPAVLSWATELEQREALGIQVRRESVSGSFVTAVVQRPFPCTEAVQLPGSRAPMEELLWAEGRAFDTEARLVGEKLLFKGAALVQILYRTAEGELATAEFELPFSQIAEVGESAEGASFQLNLQLTGLRERPCAPEGRGVELELELLAQLLVRERRELLALTDAYALRGRGECGFGVCQVPELLDQSTLRFRARELMEAPEPLRELCELRIQPLQTRLMGGELCAQVRACALCVTQRGSFCALTRTLSLTCPVTVPEHAQVRAACTVPQADAAVTETGVELRLEAEFSCTVTRLQRLRCLSAFTLEEDAEEEQERPSIVLRKLGAEESLWDAAKACRTTLAEIEQANDLGEEGAAAGRMLLIPRGR